MDPEAVLNSLSERLKATAHVDTVFGESRTAEGRTIIPVAKVAYGFGAGGGEGRAPAGEAGPEQTGSGGGGGGGVSARPVGFLIVDSEGERFVPVGPDRRRLMAACFMGFMIGLMWGRRGRR